MKFTRKEKRIYVLLFSMTCFLIIFALYKNLGSSPSNGLRNLIEYSDFEDRCKDLKNKLEKDYSEKEGEFEWNKETLEGYQTTLKEIIQDKIWKNFKIFTKNINLSNCCYCWHYIYHFLDCILLLCMQNSWKTRYCRVWG